MTDPADNEALADALRSAIAGDERGFVTIYRMLQPGLLRYATALIGADAEDATADAWLQIARDLRSFSGDVDAFRGWTARIVRNRALDLARSRSRRRTVPAGLDDLLDTVTVDTTAGAATERLSTAAAIELIASLPREQAEAVLLRAVVGLDARTAGQVLGKSAAAVRVAAHRGLRTLERRLAGERRNLATETNTDPRALN